MKDKLKIGLFFAVAFISIIQVAAALTMTLRPDGQGVYSEWTNVGCGSGSSEWQCVDEVSVNTSDYLYTSSKTKKETFTFSNTGPANMTINNLTIYYYAKRYSSSRYKVQPLIKINGNNYLGSIKNLGSSYAYVSETYNTNPKTGNPWTKSEVDALEAGMKSYKSTYGGYVAQVYVVVDYTIPDSCSDTDGGWVSTIQGTVSGYLSEQYYNSTDYCFNSTVVVEFYCVGNYSYNSTMGCDPYLNQTCVNGACV